MKTRTKALLLTLCAALLVCATVLATMAFLTAKDAVTNTFTVGNVAITLDEAKVDVYGEAATPHIADGLRDALKDNDLVLLGNHGVVSVGRTLEDAVKLVEAAEEVMKIYSYAKQIGEVSNIPDDLLESIYEHHPGSKRNRPR